MKRLQLMVAVGAAAIAIGYVGYNDVFAQVAGDTIEIAVPQTMTIADSVDKVIYVGSGGVMSVRGGPAKDPKRQYEPPRIVFEAPTEALAAACNGNTCPSKQDSGTFCNPAPGTCESPRS